MRFVCLSVLVLTLLAACGGVKETDSGVPDQKVDFQKDGEVPDLSKDMPAETSADQALDLTPDASTCGNGKIDGKEVCDGKEFGGVTCKSHGFGAGELTCKNCKTIEKNGCYTCGNGLLEKAEVCDGTKLGGKTCKTYKTGSTFDSGKLTCGSDCLSFLTTGCGTCGNKTKDGDEACDSVVPPATTCKNYSSGSTFDSGKLTCSATCAFDTTGCGTCGNAKIDGAEKCDGKQNSKTCLKEGFSGGTIGCTKTCAVDTSACHKCGDFAVSGPEDCDGKQLNGKTCKTVPGGFANGTLACKANCTFDTSSCHKCGNGKVDSGEKCDGKDLDGKTCATLGKGYTIGVLACKVDCSFDETKCTSKSCGDGVKNGTDKCDGKDLGGASCKSEGYDGGTVACMSSCQLDLSKCHKCGDKKKNGSETCDGADLDGKQCLSFPPFHSGPLACSSTCTGYDFSACLKCGDGKLTGMEKCDGQAFGLASCKTLGFDGGSLKCKADCSAIETSSCYKCGDKKKNGAEVCDGVDFGGATCKSKGFDGGSLKCKTDCSAVDTSGCTKCGNGKVETGEDCDGTALNSKTCGDMSGFIGGTLACTSACKYDTTKCVSQKWITVKANTFTMGSPTSDTCRDNDETEHKVTLTRDFEISNVEVTQGQYKTLMGYNPSTFSSCGSACPVDTVTWDEAVAYANALSVKANLVSCYSCTGSGKTVICTEHVAYSGTNLYNCTGYRLPSEAEWEYAYRAGTSTALYNGALPASNCKTVDSGAAKIGWYVGNSGAKTHAVAGKTPNSWGLYDMAGNVWEWCHDWKRDYPTSAVTDPVGAGNTGSKVRRGGAFSNTPRYLRAADRSMDSTGGKGYSHFGFRVVRTLPSKPIAHWKLDEGTGSQAKDSSVNKYDGTLSGATWTGGKIGKALKFTGGTGHVTTPLKPVYSISQSFTYAAWVRSGSSGHQTAMGFEAWQSGQVYLGLTTGGTARFYLRDDAKATGDAKSSATYADNAWHYLVGVRDRVAKKVHLYVDGALVSSVTDNTTTNINLSNKLTLDLGANYHKGQVGGPVHDANFVGDLDDLRVYDKVVGAGEIVGLYGSASSCYDGKANLNETDVDCGGPSCKKCADSKKCGVASDCLSGVCTSGVCKAGCTHASVTKSCSTDSLGISWCRVPAGCYKMGSTTESCRSSNETQHDVTLTRDFVIGATETTQAQFNTLMGYNPSSFSTCGLSCPVEQVTWHQAVAYCNALSKKAGLTPCYTCTGSGKTISCADTATYAGSKIYGCPGYRLPTEAEWEYAYRAGTTTAFYNGGITSCSGSDTNLNLIGWYSGNSSSKTHPAGQKLPNAWGLTDMSGNVWEWCQDWDGAYPSTGVQDPLETTAGTMRRYRGGSWISAASYSRAAQRYSFPHNKYDQNLGFRCVRTMLPPAVCGDGKVQGGESCDSGQLGGATCAGLGLGGGTLKCKDDCTFDPRPCLKYGIQAYYSFDQDTSGSAKDSSGNGKNGSKSGVSTSSTAGVLGKSAYFNGSGYISSGIGQSATYSHISVAFWFRSTSSGAGWATGSGDSGGDFISSEFGSAGSLSGHLRIGGYGKNHSTNASQVGAGLFDSKQNGKAAGLDDGKWHLAVFVYDSTETVAAAKWRLYIDGAASPAKYGSTTYARKLQPKYHFGIGARPTGSSAFDSNVFAHMDEVAFWSRALSATEVALLYNGGKGFNPFQ